MKSKKQNIPSQILIMAMAAIVVVLMIQMAQAQTHDGSINFGSTGSAPQSKTTMKGKSFGQKLREKTGLTYYHQFLGPNMSGSPQVQTYNVFQEGIDTPRSGQAPLQSFHALSLRFQLNSDWAVGTSLAASTFYSDDVVTRTGGVNDNDTDWFNARAFVSVPSFSTPIGTLYSTLAYEAPTSNISKNDNMQGAGVISESFVFNLPNKKWSVGLLGQYYRAFYSAKQNVVAPTNLDGPRSLQTTIISGGPYANYRFSDRWSLNSVITVDWDQRGVQADSREWNNNLPHRGRMSINYYPPIKYLSNIGLFAQSLLKFSPATTAVGADFALRF